MRKASHKMSTVFVTLADEKYLAGAKETIYQLRKIGKWKGDVVLLSVDFHPSDIPGVIIHPISHIDHQPLFKAWEDRPIRPMADGRHRGKVFQWDKLQVFSSFFQRWERLIFVDAGMRICAEIEPLLDLPWQGKFLAQDDNMGTDRKTLGSQFDLDANPEVTKDLLSTFGSQLIISRYFLNSLFIVDTQLIGDTMMRTLQEWMYRFPVSLPNEMGIMNLYFNVQKKTWQAFPEKTSTGKYLFGWCEIDYPQSQHWSNFHFIKYSVT